MIKEFEAFMLTEASELFLEVFIAEPFNLSFLEPGKAQRYLSDITKTPKFRGFCFIHSNITVGFCFGIFMDYFTSPYYDIKEIFIAKPFQGQGIGSILLSELETHLAKSGASAITLSTSNLIPAYGFYLKNNYTVSDSNLHMSKLI